MRSAIYRKNSAWGLFRVICISIFATISSVAAETNAEPAEVKVDGYGFFGNRELKASLEMLYPSGAKPEFFDANFVEDAVLILFSRLNRDGFLNPKVRAKVRLENGEEKVFEWTEPLQEPLPRPLKVKRVEFEIQEGVLFYFEFIGFRGLDELPLQNAAHFFVETDALIRLKRGRIYSPERLRRGINNLEEALERLGYESAVVTATNLVVQTNTGAARVDIIVKQGPKSWVRIIREEVHFADTNLPPRITSYPTNLVFSRIWQQDYEQQLKRHFFKDGYADTQVEIRQLDREPSGTNVFVDLGAVIRPGKQIRVADVRFEGEEDAKESMLRRRVGLKAGELLDPVKAEQGRYRLARLGIFDSVELTYEQEGPETRNVVYSVHEGKEIDISLLAGYGSYERLRGGFELEQYNLWGLGHQSRLRGVQSFKSSSADYTYTMPELLGRDFDVFLNSSWLRREEISFLREEFGGGLGARRAFKPIFTDIAGRYQFQVLNASDFDVPETEGLKKANVGAFIFDVRHDQRDNPLTPRNGYKVFTNLEVASEALAGDVDYQRVDTSGSYHLPLGRSQWMHLGISHGFVTTASGPAKDLPFNKRFFPGGDNSIRGYQYGEAAPRDAEGRLVGAESYMLANVELEQGLTRTWSMIFFFDALGTARRLENYPFDEELYSVGGGLRWKTIIGPARLEYGYNLNRREKDPAGTVHFSIGFPF